VENNINTTKETAPTTIAIPIATVDIYIYIASTHDLLAPNERTKETANATESTHGMSCPHRHKLALRKVGQVMRYGWMGALKLNVPPKLSFCNLNPHLRTGTKPTY
jgi:hypothetical protein